MEYHKNEKLYCTELGFTRISRFARLAVNYLSICNAVYRERTAMKQFDQSRLHDIGLSTCACNREVTASYFISKSLYRERTKRNG